jgi:hypothetical protein
VSRAVRSGSRVLLSGSIVTENISSLWNDDGVSNCTWKWNASAKSEVRLLKSVTLTFNDDSCITVGGLTCNSSSVKRNCPTVPGCCTRSKSAENTRVPGWTSRLPAPNSRSAGSNTRVPFSRSNRLASSRGNVTCHFALLDWSTSAPWFSSTVFVKRLMLTLFRIDVSTSEFIHPSASQRS